MIERQLTKKRATRDWKTLLGRELPANVDAEKAALAAVLLNDENFAQVAETLLTTDFYSPAHQNIFQVVSDLSRDNKK
ncbi:hypothetical protein KAU11_04845, partial [Candidatus Babeliales bacterium]|nr:hypothetical protein [Candidatus Babeliales bacterium]